MAPEGCEKAGIRWSGGEVGVSMNSPVNLTRSSSNERLVASVVDDADAAASERIAAALEVEAELVDVVGHPQAFLLSHQLYSYS